MHKQDITVGIAGAGAVAFGSAALLCANGHKPVLWSPSGRSTMALSAGKPLVSSNAIDGQFQVQTVQNAQQLVTACDVLLLALPAYGHKTVMDAVAPHIRQGQIVIVSSHASFGALYLFGLLQERGITVPVCAWGTTAVTGRKRSDAEITVNTVRAKIDCCTVPAAETDRVLGLCTRLFGDRFQLRDGLLAITLSNLNPQNHMGIALGNISRMERGENWSQGQNVTPKIGALLEALDSERLEIARALDVSVRTIFEHFHLSFHVPVNSISQMNQDMHQQGNGGTGPATADTRYVTEDVPYGLVTTVALGELAGRQVKLHKAGVDIFSAMYGRDFSAENQLLQAIRLKNRSLAQLQEAAYTGILPALE